MGSNQTTCRFLYVIGQLALGGAERQLYYLLATLSRTGYRVALAAWNTNPHEKYYRELKALNIPIYGLPRNGGLIGKLWSLRAIARSVTPEVIHSYGFHTNFAAFCASQGTGAVPVGSLRSDFATIKRVGGVLRGALNSRWPSCHISNSAVCAATAKQASRFFIPKQYCVVRNGMELSRFAPSGMGTYILAIGSLLAVKRWDRLLRAVRKLRDEGEGRLDVRIAGDGPLLHDLKRLAQTLGISEQVTFLGAVEDVPTLLQGARFLVHTSDSEGCPNVVMEAMAAGKAVIAMNSGDISYLIEDGTTGFVVPRGDEKILVSRMATLLHDGGLCQKFGDQARVVAEREFNLDKFVARTLDAYRTAGWKEKQDDESMKVLVS